MSVPTDASETRAFRSLARPLFLISRENDATGILSIVCQVEWKKGLAMNLTSMKTKTILEIASLVKEAAIRGQYPSLRVASSASLGIPWSPMNTAIAVKTYRKTTVEILEGKKGDPGVSQAIQRYATKSVTFLSVQKLNAWPATVKATEVPWITQNQARHVSAGISRHHTGTNSCQKDIPTRALMIIIAAIPMASRGHGATLLTLTPLGSIVQLKCALTVLWMRLMFPWKQLNV